jgi:uncharacterized protein YceK
MTIANNSSIGDKSCNRVYLGTRMFVSGFGHLSEPGALPLMVLFLIDLPFSFTVDTLLLPYTIPSSIQECRLENAEKEIRRKLAEKDEKERQEERREREQKLAEENEKKRQQMMKQSAEEHEKKRQKTTEQPKEQMKQE